MSHALALHRGVMAAPSGPTKLDTRENPFTQARRFGSLKLFLKVSLESVLGVIYIETSLLIPGIPRPQFLGSLRTTPKVRERPQKCNFGSANKGLPNMFSSMPFFFWFSAICMINF